MFLSILNDLSEGFYAISDECKMWSKQKVMRSNQSLNTNSKILRGMIWETINQI
jgi:hypothetical protein